MRRVITKDDVVKTKAVRIEEFEGVTPEQKMTLIAPKRQPPAPQVLTEDDYLSKVVKYIPAEIVAVFVTINGILKPDPNVPAIFHWLLFIVLLVLTPLYIWRFASVKGLPPPYAQVAISTISFIIWVFALGGPFDFLGWYKSIYGSILLILFTLVPPLIVGR